MLLLCRRPTSRGPTFAAGAERRIAQPNRGRARRVRHKACLATDSGTAGRVLPRRCLWERRASDAAVASGPDAEFRHGFPHQLDVACIRRDGAADRYGARSERTGPVERDCRLDEQRLHGCHRKCQRAGHGNGKRRRTDDGLVGNSGGKRGSNGAAAGVLGRGVTADRESRRGRYRAAPCRGARRKGQRGSGHRFPVVIVRRVRRHRGFHRPGACTSQGHGANLSSC